MQSQLYPSDPGEHRHIPVIWDGLQICKFVLSKSYHCFTWWDVGCGMWDVTWWDVGSWSVPMRCATAAIWSPTNSCTADISRGTEWMTRAVNFTFCAWLNNLKCNDNRYIYLSIYLYNIMIYYIILLLLLLLHFIVFHFIIISFIFRSMWV